MRSRTVPYLVLLVLALPAVGCSSNNKGKIEGTSWTSQAATVKGKPLPAGVLQLEFYGDGKLVYRAGPQTMTGKYSLGWGDYITMNLDQELAGRKTHRQKVIISNGELTMVDSDGTQMTFSKAN